MAPVSVAPVAPAAVAAVVVHDHCTDKPRILLIGPGQSYRLAPYLRAADALAVELLVVSDSRFSLTLEVAEGIQVDFNQPTKAIEHIRTITLDSPVAGVVATDDSAVELAALIAQALNLPTNPVAAARFSRRKDLARQRLQWAGVDVPDHWRLDLSSDLPSQLAPLPYPLVLKPISLSASRGVIRVDNPEEALDACDVIANIIAPLETERERKTLLAERYLAGREVALEAFLHQGKLIPLALFDKPDPLTGPYFEETYYITPSRLPTPLQQQIEQTVELACKAYGLQQGPVHAELRITQDRTWILEVASRTIGGECSRVLDQLLGQPLEQLVLTAAQGLPISIKRQRGAAGVLMIPTPRAGVLRHINGEERIRELPHIRDIRLSVEPGQVIETLPWAAGYLGFIYSAAETPAKVEQALRLAHAQLEIVIDPLLSVGT